MAIEKDSRCFSVGFDITNRKGEVHHICIEWYDAVGLGILGLCCAVVAIPESVFGFFNWVFGKET